MTKKVTSKTRRFPPKKPLLKLVDKATDVVAETVEKTILPKRMSKDEIKAAVKEAVDAEVVKDEEPKVEEYVEPTKPEDMKVITLNVDPNPKGKSTIDLGGVSIPDAILVLKGFHSYLLDEFIKRMALVNGSKEGTADTAGGSNT
jgi:hypothetical protein